MFLVGGQLCCLFLGVLEMISKYIKKNFFFVILKKAGQFLTVTYYITKISVSMFLHFLKCRDILKYCQCIILEFNELVIIWNFPKQTEVASEM